MCVRSRDKARPVGPAQRLGIRPPSIPISSLGLCEARGPAFSPGSPPRAGRGQPRCPLAPPLPGGVSETLRGRAQCQELGAGWRGEPWPGERMVRGRHAGWSCGISPLGPRPAPAASGKLPRRLGASATHRACSGMFPGPAEHPSEPLLCCPSPAPLPSASWAGLVGPAESVPPGDFSRSSLLCALLLNLQLFTLHEDPSSLFATFDNGRVPASSPPPRSCSSLHCSGPRPHLPGDRRLPGAVVPCSPIPGASCPCPARVHHGHACVCTCVQVCAGL